MTDILTFHSRKSPGGSHKINDGSGLFKCPRKPHQRAIMHTNCALMDAAIISVINLICVFPAVTNVKLSAMKKFETQNTGKKFL